MKTVIGYIALNRYLLGRFTSVLKAFDDRISNVKLYDCSRSRNSCLHYVALFLLAKILKVL